MSRATTLARLANEFGRCGALSASRGSDEVPAIPPHRRLRQMARGLDRLARRPSNRTWHRRAARLHREIDLALRGGRQPAAHSLWAAA